MFLPAILGPEMAAPILWAPGKIAFFLQENLHAHKIPCFRGGGYFGFFLGGGSADFIFMDARIFLICLLTPYLCDFPSFSMEILTAPLQIGTHNVGFSAQISRLKRARETIGSEQKRPGANRPPEFVPESPLQKGVFGSHIFSKEV